MNKHAKVASMLHRLESEFTSTVPPNSQRVLPTTAIMGLERALGLGRFWADRSIPYRAGEYNSSLTLPPSLYALYAYTPISAITSCQVGKSRTMEAKSCRPSRLCFRQGVSIDREP